MASLERLDISMGRIRKSAEIAYLVALRQGIAAYLGRTAKVKVRGKRVSRKELLRLVDALIAEVQATAAARLAHAAAVRAERTRRAQLRPLLTSVRALLQATLSDEQLAACGLPARQERRSLSTDERIARVAKLRATRAAKRTSTARQRRLAKANAVIAGMLVPAQHPLPATSSSAPPEVAAARNGVSANRGRAPE